MAKDTIVGGQRYVVKTRADRLLVATDDPPTVFDGVTWIPRGKGGACGCHG